MADTGQYDSQTNIETEDYEREIFVRPEAAVIYGGSAVNSVNGQVGDVVLTTSDLENTSDYQTGTEVESAISTAIAGKQDTLTAGNNITISNNTISATDTTYSAFTGTDGTAAGASGLVPAPQATDVDKYLKSDGTWATVSGGGGGTTNYNGLTNKPSVNGVELIGNKTLEQLGVRNFVIQILIEYGLIGGGELTPEQIQALNEMTCVINNDGDLVINYDEQVLNISFSKPGVDLIMDNNINAVFYINNNNLEVTYDNN